MQNAFEIPCTGEELIKTCCHVERRHCTRKQVVAKLVFWPGCWSCSKTVMYHCFRACYIAPAQHMQKVEARLGWERLCQEIVDANMSSQTPVCSLVCEAVDSLLRPGLVHKDADLLLLTQRLWKMSFTTVVLHIILRRYCLHSLLHEAFKALERFCSVVLVIAKW